VIKDLNESLDSGNRGVNVSNTRGRNHYAQKPILESEQHEQIQALIVIVIPKLVFAHNDYGGSLVIAPTPEGKV
jgi:hypothetical protein